MLFKNLISSILLAGFISALDFTGRYAFSSENDANICYDAYELNLEPTGTFVKRSKDCATFGSKLSYGSWSSENDSTILETTLPNLEYEEVEVAIYNKDGIRYGNTKLDRTTDIKSIDFVTNLFNKWGNGKGKTIQFTNGGRLIEIAPGLNKNSRFAIASEKSFNSEFLEIAGTATQNNVKTNWVVKVNLENSLVYNGETFTKIAA